MSTIYAAEMYVDLGEKIHVRSTVKPRCEQDIPFAIKAARWELWAPDRMLESTGDCQITDHQLDALISPQKRGTYQFKYIYEVADEIWIDVIKVVVG